MDDSKIQESRRSLEGKSKGTMGTAVETSSSEGLQILQAHQGFFRCHFVVPDHLLDQHGNWHAGAIATLIDIVGAAAVYSIAGHAQASVDFTVSFFSTAKFQEEIEIEAKVVGGQGNLIAFVVEIIRKSSGELIAIGKQWTTTKPQARSSRL
ncbi:hypothetical protein L484_026225 [Morus notabilis]|uniref:Acyl-coenzyme A thioesterase 13 n=1 Tax=Morus notabilis TaxID=981085 RepID=W9RUX2_9ROSA|nr:uncharacterized protein LOC21408888 [Morus notabilis]EXB74528.1 hypothetical protein L484_026225 [Morus notabilis]